MTRIWRPLLRDHSASAAAEMAFVLPLLLIIMLGSAELGNYFMNEHGLVKAVRDGARFAARQPFGRYTSCSGSPDAAVVNDTRNVVLKGYLDPNTGTTITPNLQAINISVTTSCATTAGGQNMTGIYQGRVTGAQIVTVSATATYQPILASLGFSGVGIQLNASSQAAVMGV
jgi:Flp pilus assembly protein TadG